VAPNLHGFGDGAGAERLSPHGRFGGAGSCMDTRGMAEKEEWVVWNGSMGILMMAAIGHVEDGEGGRSAFLAPPFDMVGPFSLDELETQGRIAFAECLVMSRERWQADQVELRMEGLRKRRSIQLSMAYVDDREHREALDLPMEGPLEPAEIKAAFRKMAKFAHPDAGGSDEDYRRIAEARDVLLEKFATLS
jgi:hypothetical protein